MPECKQPQKTQSYMDTIIIEYDPKWSPYQKDTIPNGHHSEWHNPEWT